MDILYVTHHWPTKYFSIFEIISDDNCYGQIAFKIHVVLLHCETPTMRGLAPITVELSKLKELLHASIIIVNTILSEKKRIGAEWLKKLQAQLKVD